MGFYFVMSKSRSRSGKKKGQRKLSPSLRSVHGFLYGNVSLMVVIVMWHFRAHPQYTSLNTRTLVRGRGTDHEQLHSKGMHYVYAQSAVARMQGSGLPNSPDELHVKVYIKTCSICA